MPSDFEPNPQGPLSKGVVGEWDLDWLLSLATALQAQQRHLQSESSFKGTTEQHRSDSHPGAKKP
jgi:hypothetical protein